MIVFPTILYKSPGKHLTRFGTFNYVGVKTQAEFDAKIKEGWHPSQAAAFAHVKQKTSPPEVVQPAPIQTSDDSAPPTREELEQKATELGLKFDGRTTDKKLLERIEEALKG